MEWRWICFIMGCIFPVLTNAQEGLPEAIIPFDKTVKFNNRTTHEIETSNWSVGGETIDRDYTVYEYWGTYLEELGVKKVRILSGWEKTEISPEQYNGKWMDDIVIEMVRQGELHLWIIPGTFWFDRLDARSKMADIEEENADIAGVLSRLSDEMSGHFSPQIPVKIKRTGYTLCYGNSLHTTFTDDSRRDPPRTEEANTMFKEVPLYDSPIDIAENNLLPLN